VIFPVDGVTCKTYNTQSVSLDRFAPRILHLQNTITLCDFLVANHPLYEIMILYILTISTISNNCNMGNMNICSDWDPTTTICSIVFSTTADEISNMDNILQAFLILLQTAYTIQEVLLKL